jgi:mediator of RNA polymerase II transcription subunit 8, fungi type
VEDARKVAASVGTSEGTNGSGDGKKGIDMDGLVEIWGWAGDAVHEEAAKRNWESEFTLEEKEGGVENVRTGLRRKLEDPESGDEEDDVEDDVKPVEAAQDGTSYAGPRMPIEDVLRFVSRGTLPAQPVVANMSGGLGMAGRR